MLYAPHILDEESEAPQGSVPQCVADAVRLELGRWLVSTSCPGSGCPACFPPSGPGMGGAQRWTAPPAPPFPLQQDAGSSWDLFCFFYFECMGAWEVLFGENGSNKTEM